MNLETRFRHKVLVHATTTADRLWQSSVVIWTLLVGLSALVPTKGNCQTDLLDLLSPETAAVITLHEPKRAFDWLLHSELANNKQLSEAWNLISAEPFPILNHERAEKLLQLQSELIDLTESVKCAYLIIHDWNGVVPTVSFVVEIEDDRTLDELARLWRDVSSLLGERTKPLSDSEVESEKDIVEIQVDDVTSTFSSMRSNLRFAITNNDAFAARLAQSGDKEQAKSIKSARTFQIAESHFEKSKNAIASVLSVYVDPQQFRRFFLAMNDELWDALSVDELSVAGGLVGITKTTDETGQSAIVFEGFVVATQPMKGIGAKWASYQSINHFPPLPFDVLELRASACDMRAYVEANRRIYDQAYGEGTYDDSLKSQGFEVNDQLLDDIGARTGEKVGIAYFNSVGNRATMSFERIRDGEAMNRFVKSVVDAANGLKGDERMQFAETSFNGWPVWVQSQKTAKEALQGAKDSRGGQDDPRKRVGEISTAHAHALVHDWYISGDYSDVKLQIEHLMQASGNDSFDVRRWLPRLNPKVLGGRKPSAITYSSKESTINKIRGIQARRIVEKYRGDQRRTFLRQLATKEDFSLTIDSEIDRAFLVVDKCALTLATFFGEQTSLFFTSPDSFEFVTVFFESLDDQE